MPQDVLAGGRRRRALNLSIRDDVIAAAKALGVNASHAAEEGIAQAVRRAREQAWLASEHDAIQEHTAWIEAEGIPLQPAWPG